MSKNELLLIIPPVLIILAFLLIYYIRKAKLYNKIKENSQAIKDLMKLNEEYSSKFCNDLNESYRFDIDCDYLQQYKVCNKDKALYSIVELNESVFLSISTIVNHNIEYYNEYQAKIESINQFLSQDDCLNLEIDYEKAHVIEKDIFDTSILSVRTNPKVYIDVDYTSAAGQSRHHKQFVYEWEQIVKQIRVISNYERFKTTKEYQRSRMNNSLRYDVLKRDGFKCVICGRTAADGIKLHVDHIVPVSKGGKTELSNLRTLCDECNLGKSAKI